MLRDLSFNFLTTYKFRANDMQANIDLCSSLNQTITDHLFVLLTLLAFQTDQKMVSYEKPLAPNVSKMSQTGLLSVPATIYFIVHKQA